MLLFFIRGLIVGFVICAPGGPVGLLCVRRALMDGRLAGMAAVLGASTVDAVYCAIAGLGMSYLSNFLTNEHLYLRIAGGLILILVGLRIFFAPPSEKTPETKGHGLFPSFISSFFLMLANPMPILVFTATLTALGVHGWKDAYLATSALVAGVFVGSALWAPILAATVAYFKPQISPHQLRLANRIAGAVIMGFGAAVCIIAIS
jgi:threonine/homoserine/homoserine lactone efflux protein